MQTCRRAEAAPVRLVTKPRRAYATARVALKKGSMAVMEGEVGERGGERGVLGRGGLSTGKNHDRGSGWCIINIDLP